MKTLTALLIATLLILSAFYLRVETKLFQGPIPEGADEAVFRSTGKTVYNTPENDI